MGQSSSQTSSLLFAAIYSEALQAYYLSLSLSSKEPLFSLFPTSSTPQRLGLMRVLTRQCTRSLSSDPLGNRGKKQIDTLSLLLFCTRSFGPPQGQYRLVSLQLDHFSSLVLLSVIVQQNQMAL